MKLMSCMNCLSMLFCFTFLTTSASIAQQSWRGLIVEPENRCTPYNKKLQYPYPQSVEDIIVADMGGQVYGPYSGRYFVTDTETDIEHIVAASEGHDSGLCSASAKKKAQFATDLLNLTLASPEVNRCGVHGKCGYDAAEWLPEKNQCWYANRIVEIKKKYSLSVDLSEAKALDKILGTCNSVKMIFFPRENQKVVVRSNSDPSNTLLKYDANNNGRISCSEARHHSIAPVRQGHPVYVFMNDRDGDGVVCE